MYCRQESFLERKLELEGSYTALTQYLANLWNFWIPNLFLWGNTFRYPVIGDWVLSHVGININILFVLYLLNSQNLENGDWVLSHGYKLISIFYLLLFVLYWVNFQNLEYTTYSLENFENIIHSCTLSMVIGSSLMGIINIDISFFCITDKQSSLQHKLELDGLLTRNLLWNIN